jgi:hypothetical protein
MSKEPDMKSLEQLEHLLKSVEVDSDAHEEIIYNRIKYKIETGKLGKELVAIPEKRRDSSFSLSKGMGICAVFVFALFFTYTNGYLDFIFKDKAYEITGYRAMQNEKIEYGELEQGEELFTLGIASSESDIQSDRASYKIAGTIWFEDDEIKTLVKEPIKVPQYVPGGYAFIEGLLIEESSQVHFSYTNAEGDSIVIFAFLNGEGVTAERIPSLQETTVGEISVTYGENAAFWEIEGVYYELFWGFISQRDSLEIDIHEVLKIIQSMQ